MIISVGNSCSSCYIVLHVVVIEVRPNLSNELSFILHSNV